MFDDHIDIHVPTDLDTALLHSRASGRSSISMQDVPLSRSEKKYICSRAPRFLVMPLCVAL